MLKSLKKNKKTTKHFNSIYKLSTRLKIKNVAFYIIFK